MKTALKTGILVLIAAFFLSLTITPAAAQTDVLPGQYLFHRPAPPEPTPAGFSAYSPPATDISAGPFFLPAAQPAEQFPHLFAVDPAFYPAD